MSIPHPYIKSPIKSFTMAQQYQYAFTLQAHTSDVRHVLPPQQGVPLLLSRSRDGTACMWGPSSSSAVWSGGSGFGNASLPVGGEEWDVKLRVEGPEKRFVSCVGMVRAQGEGELKTVDPSPSCGGWPWLLRAALSLGRLAGVLVDMPLVA